MKVNWWNIQKIKRVHFNCNREQVAGSWSLAWNMAGKLNHVTYCSSIAQCNLSCDFTTRYHTCVHKVKGHKWKFTFHNRKGVRGTIDHSNFKFSFNSHSLSNHVVSIQLDSHTWQLKCELRTCWLYVIDSFLSFDLSNIFKFQLVTVTIKHTQDTLGATVCVYMCVYMNVDVFALDNSRILILIYDTTSCSMCFLPLNQVVNWQMIIKFNWIK